MAVPPASGLAAALPDEPQWLEIRAMLSSGHAVVTGGDTVDSGFVVRVAHGAVSAVAVVGHPPAAAIAEAVAGATELTPVIAQTSDAAHVAESLRSAAPRSWTGERAILHLRDESVPLRASTDVRLLTPADSLEHLPAGLHHEITHAREFAPVAAVFAGARAVSFCYPVWTTERFWDVSIDTLEEHRGRSHGARAVSFMIDRMRRQGREPVWGALESNQPSLRLGAKLGFRPVGDIMVFSTGGWVFLSGGFAGA
jgi:RimJ/RimL family protein N-acetyltransferase